MTLWQMNAWELIAAGGPLMYPILLCSVVALTIIFEKIIYFSSLKTDTQQFKQKVFDLIKANNITEAINSCDANPSPVARILKAGTVKFGSSREEIKEEIETAGHFEIPKLEKGLSALATIAHISPLLGLLGTVTGICGSFYAIQAKSATLSPVTPGDLAAGIWEALLTTVAGLMVAIPAFVVYNYFTYRINTIVLDMEKAGTESMSLLCQASEIQATKEKRSPHQTEI